MLSTIDTSSGQNPPNVDSVDHNDARFWGTSAWLPHAEAWVREWARGAGVGLLSEFMLYRNRPWSSHYTLESDMGRLWFKASCGALGFEPALQTQIAAFAPELVHDPLAIDSDRGWMLTLDQGTPVGNDHNGTLVDWLTFVLQIVSLQQGLMGHRERVLATGIPDCSPGTVVDRFDRLVVLLSQLPSDHPSQLSDLDVAELAAVRADVEHAVDVLMDGPLGPSWQHGDAHLGNAFTRADGVAVFDFGDSQWGHVLETLVVPYSILETEHPNWWNHVESAWRHAWGLNEATFTDMWTAARRTQAVNRAATWHAINECVSAEPLHQWADRARHHLLRTIDV